MHLFPFPNPPPFSCHCPPNSHPLSIWHYVTGVFSHLEPCLELWALTRDELTCTWFIIASQLICAADVYSFFLSLPMGYQRAAFYRLHEASDCSPLPPKLADYSQKWIQHPFRERSTLLLPDFEAHPRRLKRWNQCLLMIKDGSHFQVDTVMASYWAVLYSHPNNINGLLGADILWFPRALSCLQMDFQTGK